MNASLPRQSRPNLVDDLRRAGFYIVSRDLEASRCTAEQALKHVADRMEWWPGAQAIIERHGSHE